MKVVKIKVVDEGVTDEGNKVEGRIDDGDGKIKVV